LIMLSEAYHSFFLEKTPDRYIEMAKAMGVDITHSSDSTKPAAFIKALLKLQKACGVDDLKMSGYGVSISEIPVLAENAWHAMGGLFKVDPYNLSMDETIQIMTRAYR
jgi:alcohol dehydrogenase